VKAIYDDVHAHPSEKASFEDLRDASHVTVPWAGGDV
tara:strand:- start:1759 stop:1869 length:111 start_codon:yes stop_codon:yes gene_type:complete